MDNKLIGQVRDAASEAAAEPGVIGNMRHYILDAAANLLTAAMELSSSGKTGYFKEKYEKAKENLGFADSMANNPPVIKQVAVSMNEKHLMLKFQVENEEKHVYTVSAQFKTEHVWGFADVSDAWVFKVVRDGKKVFHDRVEKDLATGLTYVKRDIAAHAKSQGV